jgi:hypothetical protein
MAGLLLPTDGVKAEWAAGVVDPVNVEAAVRIHFGFTRVADGGAFADPAALAMPRGGWFGVLHGASI